LPQKGLAIRVKGKVQGVGFRPFVWQLAQDMGLAGDVLNDGEGVLIRLLNTSAIDLFQTRLVAEQPPLARIDSQTFTEFLWESPPDNFSIKASESTSMDTQIVPDAATCPECLAELYDPANRRFHYPFINCTHCGPRFTIINALPYDRPKTVMSDFPMCPECQAEYNDPSNRRYHAQPIACEKCGPRVWVVNSNGETLERDWLISVVTALKQGQIIAIKSVGGFHLACDATNTMSVQTLRDRKSRQFKPFAVMVSGIHAAQRLAYINQYQEELLSSRVAPIVLLKKKHNVLLADNIAPQLVEIGLMLPSNPLQHLLSTTFAKPLVMTSANGSGLPPAMSNEEAFKQLCGIADLFIMHDRAIVQRCDDSLTRIDDKGQIEVLRRSRGFVPDALNLPEDFPDADGYLAYGGDLKNAFAIGKGRQIIVSQYLGDLANFETQQQYKQAIEHYTSLYQLNICHHVTDKHPGYFSHQLAHTCHKNDLKSSLTEIQHHHAHIASCLIENGWTRNQGKVLALALDGLGFGEYTTEHHPQFWGGELMVADYCDFQRIGGLPTITQTGGELAARQPWRSYLAHLKAFVPSINEQNLAVRFPDKPVHLLSTAIDKQLNTHSIHSAGRLFDAVAASLGIVGDTTEYEGQAACQLEALALKFTSNPKQALTIPLMDFTLDLASFWEMWLNLIGEPEEKAYLFHYALAQSLVNLVINASEKYKTDTLILTGGVFHNQLLTKLIKEMLPEDIQVLEHKQYSCGDGSLALGQMAIALCQSN